MTPTHPKDWSDNLNKIDEPNNDKFSFLEFIWDLIKTAVVVLIIAFGIKYFVVQPFIVDGSSMLPNFENNEYLLVEKISYHFKEPSRGDVIVFHPPGQADENYIKRVIGLPNETVEIKDNKIYIFNSDHPSGVEISEPFIPSDFQTLTEQKDTKYKVGPDEFFVLGDNREHSSDSREWGLLPKGNIIGKSWLNIYPFKDFGLVKHQAFPL
jgi:signal peptidase I